MTNGKVVILVMCGSSVATSTVAAEKILEESKKRKISIVIKKGKVGDAESLIEMYHPDYIVATAVLKERTDIKVYNGVPLISGIGQEELLEELFSNIANNYKGE